MLPMLYNQSMKLKTRAMIQKEQEQDTTPSAPSKPEIKKPVRAKRTATTKVVPEPVGITAPVMEEVSTETIEISTFTLDKTDENSVLKEKKNKTEIKKKEKMKEKDKKKAKKADAKEKTKQKAKAKAKKAKKAKKDKAKKVKVKAKIKAKKAKAKSKKAKKNKKNKK
jgi:hypothetical protein